MFRIRIKCDTQIANAKGRLVRASKLFCSLRPDEYLLLSGKRCVWGHRFYIVGLRLTTKEYLIVATQVRPETALDDYAKRWEIETLFGCLKTRGFRFESTHMTDPARISKLVAILAIAFCWAHLVGEWLHAQYPIQIKKHGRRAKSIFRYGYDYLRGVLINFANRVQEFLDCLGFLSCT